MKKNTKNTYSKKKSVKTTASSKHMINTKVSKASNVAKNSKINNVPTKAGRGNTMQTRDEYMAGQKGKNIKPEHPNENDMYRTVAILKANSRDEYCIVPLTTKKYKKLKHYYDKKTHAKDIIETFDCNGSPIQQGKMFILNKGDCKKINSTDMDAIEKYCLIESKRKQRNQNQLDRFNNRGKKE